MGERRSRGSRVTRAGPGPEAEAQRTSGAQRAAMLEQRRRRRGASWVPAAAPVGWGRGPSRTAEGLSARWQGGCAAGSLPAQPRLSPHPHPVPSDPTLGLRDPSGSPRGPAHLAASETPAPTRGSGPRDADSQLEGSDLPPPGVRLERPFPSPIFHQLPLSPPGAHMKGIPWPGCGLYFRSFLQSPEDPSQGSRPTWAEEHPVHP